MSLKQILRRQHEAVRRLTLEVAAAMPAADYEYKPWPGSMSFADHLRHVASAERTLVQALRTGAWNWNQGISGASHPEPAAVQELLQETARELYGLLDELAEADLTAPRAFPWGEQTLADALMEWLVHEGHHRGQAYLHLRLAGRVPPEYH